MNLKNQTRFVAKAAVETKSKILLLNLPSPPNQNLWRDTAGGFGTSLSCLSKQKMVGETALHPFLPYAVSVLRDAGFEFEVLDCQRLKLDNLRTLELVKKINPKIVFSIISLPSMKNDLQLLGKLKNSISDLTTVGVGTVCHILPDEILGKSRIDFLLRNSYPYFDGITELSTALMKSKTITDLHGISLLKNGKVIHTQDRPDFKFENLPNPNYDSVQLDGYETFTDTAGRRHPSVLIIESKGCPYGCIYCPYPLGYGRQLTFRSAEKIVDELEYLHYSRRIDAFAFKGQTFAYSKKHAYEICDEIIKRKLDISWVCESRVDETSRELLGKMTAAGCKRIHFGVETGDAETLKIAKPGVKLNMVKRAFSLTKEYGVTTQAHVILGWPEDTFETLTRTRKFVLQLNPDVINLNFFTPYPGTKMFEMAQKASLLLTTDWTNYTSHKVVMRTKSLNEDQLYAVKNRIVRDFSILKLMQHVEHFGSQGVKRPGLFINKAKALVNRALFPMMT